MTESIREFSFESDARIIKAMKSDDSPLSKDADGNSILKVWFMTEFIIDPVSHESISYKPYPDNDTTKEHQKANTSFIPLSESLIQSDFPSVFRLP